MEVLTFSDFCRKDNHLTESLVLVESESRHKTSRFLSRSFVIDLQQPKSNSAGFRLVVKLHGDRKYSTRHLLWKLLYRGITVLEWFILYREFETQLTESALSEKTESLGILLFLCQSTRKRQCHWESTSKPLFKSFKAIDPTVDSNFSNIGNLLDYFTTVLKLPQKGDNVQNIYLSYRAEYYQRKAIPVNRIGVGYKDKGSLSKGLDEEPFSLDPYQPELNFGIKDYLDTSLRKLGKHYQLSSNFF